MNLKEQNDTEIREEKTQKKLKKHRLRKIPHLTKNLKLIQMKR